MQTFVAGNGVLFARCRRLGRDDLRPDEREWLRLGFLEYHPRLAHITRPETVSLVRWSNRRRSKGCFYAHVGRRRVWLPRKCKPLSATAALANLMRGSVRAQRDMVARGRPRSWEVDHEHVKFADLCSSWIREQQVSRRELLTSRAIRKGIHTLGDPWHQSWARYHRQHARLRAIPAAKHRLLTAEMHRREAAAKPS